MLSGQILSKFHASHLLHTASGNDQAVSGQAQHVGQYRQRGGTVKIPSDAEAILYLNDPYRSLDFLDVIIQSRVEEAAREL